MEGRRRVEEDVTAKHISIYLLFVVVSHTFHSFPPFSIPILSSLLSSHHPSHPPPFRQADCDARVKELSEMEE